MLVSVRETSSLDVRSHIETELVFQPIQDGLRLGQLGRGEHRLRRHLDHRACEVLGDATPWIMGASDTGGSWSLEYMGTVLDRVCWGSAVVGICEGTVLATPPPAAGSYERKANSASTAASMSSGGADQNAGNSFDSSNNATDFVLRPLRGAQSSMSPAEP